MKYKVWNPENDMKIAIGGKVYVIKRGTKISLSQLDYQHLAQVYGMAVKGEKEYFVFVNLQRIHKWSQKPS